MNRWKAFALHLLLSLVIISGIAAAALLTWYPYGLYRIAGLDRLMMVMLCIDIVAGPLLTLVVYKAGKSSLRMDLTIVALVQAAFLGYGLHTLWQSRPVFLVAIESRFNLVFANEIEQEELAKAPNKNWRQYSWYSPKLVGALPPTDPKEREALLFSSLAGGADLHVLPRYYVDYSRVASLLLTHKGKTSTGMIRTPVISRFGEASLLLDGRTGQPIKTE